MPNERLHLKDSLLLQFNAQVTAVGAFQDKPSLQLDRTAFYAEAGGQRPDRGTLHLRDLTIAVRDVQLDDAGVVHHLVDVVPENVVGQVVHGTVDEIHRRDQMSQHTGQHMLSRAFFDVAGLETVSARLGSETSTIDLKIGALGREVIESAVRRVNDAVLEDRPVRILFPSQEELAALQLRKAVTVDHDIRVIEVEGFDLTPCGGTHCLRTGQVGPVVVTAQEKYKGATRITFLAGQRALRYWQSLETSAKDASAALTVTPPEMVDAIARLKEELETRSQQLGHARAELARRQAQELLDSHPANPGGNTWIFVDLHTEDIDVLRTLAAALAQRADVVAVTSSIPAGSTDRLVVAHRGAAATADTGKWFKSLAALAGGRGGGRPEHAEGKIPAGADWGQLQHPPGS
jgi:alanyl-tRNA synthetase